MWENEGRIGNKKIKKLFHKTAGNTHCPIIWCNATRFSVYRKDEKLYDAI